MVIGILQALHGGSLRVVSILVNPLLEILCSLVLGTAPGEYEGSLIRNIVLFGVLVYELIGPMMTKMALTRAGDIRPVEAAKRDRRRFFPRR